MHLGHEEFITDEIIQKLIQNATKNASVNGEILEVVPNEYRLDSKKTEVNPVGVACTEIEASFKLIVGRASLKKMIEKAVEDKSDLTVAGTPLSQRAAASVLLSDADKILGCALIDFGAGTTSVSVYKDGLLRHLAVIPFGGQVVTKDISSENLLEGDAEKLKTSYGSAVFNPESDNKVFKVKATNHMDEPKIELHTLNNIIEGRMVEIIQNVWNQIEQSGFSKQLGAGIYITGGASQMRNITDLIKSETGVDVRKAAINRNIINSSSSTESMQNPSYGVIVGLVMSNSLNCVRVAKPIIDEPVLVDELINSQEDKFVEPVKPPKPPKPKGPNKLNRIKNIFGNLFGESENMDSDMK
jgi:cell division protein FtsA